MVWLPFALEGDLDFELSVYVMSELFITMLGAMNFSDAFDR